MSVLPDPDAGYQVVLAHTLLGAAGAGWIDDGLNSDEFKFVLSAVAGQADALDEEIQKNFGGKRFADTVALDPLPPIVVSQRSGHGWERLHRGLVHQQLLEAGHEVVATIRAPEREREVRIAVATRADVSARLEFAVADLSHEDGWDDAASECEYVLHVASPLSVEGEDADSVITRARDGTLRVLAAASRSGVARVVVTSSCAAATPYASQLSGTVDEQCWTDADEPGLATYRRSKVLAEAARRGITWRVAPVVSS